MDTDFLTLKIKPISVIKSLIYIVVFLAIASIFVNILRLMTGNDFCCGLVPLFDFYREHNIPSYYSSVQLLLAAVILFIIATMERRANQRYKYHWFLLSLTFFFLSFDEITGLHEKLSRPMSQLLNTCKESLLYCGWLVVYIPLTLIFALLFAKFLLYLPKKTRLLFMASGTFFVLGAIGFEFLESIFIYLYSWKIHTSFIYFIFTTIEEFLEMGSISFFIYALFDYITTKYNSISITISK